MASRLIRGVHFGVAYSEDSSMPRNYGLTWVEGRKLWRKVYKGHVYTISCRQLGLSEGASNKVGSYQAANAWW
jgi:hypothetical protein